MRANPNPNAIATPNQNPNSNPNHNAHPNPNPSPNTNANQARAKLARESTERMGQLKAMRKNTASRTDNDLLDDVVDGQSVAAVRAARAKAGTEVRRRTA